MQGSSINNIFVDLGDIKRCRDTEEFRQLEYVALSRVRNNIYILN
nr:MAG TPA: ATP dependent DNA helicase [Caudoviricetes sp.]